MLVKLFSVVIPLYNKEISIRSTIESVLSQTYTGFELIIINDGSTDNSLAVAESFHDERIKIITKENGGVSSARNTGILAAKNEWIAFIDGDDLWQTEYLSTVVEMIQKYPNAGMVVSKYTLSSNIASTTYYYDGNGYFHDLYFLLRKYGNIIFTSAVCVKKVCFLEAGLFNENLFYGEDIDMWLRIANFFTLTYCPVPTVVYNLEAENRACKSKINIHKHWVMYFDLDRYNVNDCRGYYYFVISSTLIDFIDKHMFYAAYCLIKRYGFKEIIKSFKYRKLN